MRTWARAVTITACGGPCRGSIDVGRPVQRITIPGCARVLLRCQRCADAPVPDDLEPLDDPTPTGAAAVEVEAAQRLTGAYQPEFALEDRR